MATQPTPSGGPTKSHGNATSKEKDWTKPAAMAVPKGGFFADKVEQGRYGPIFPRTPACYGFTIIAKIIPGREDVFYGYAKKLETALAGEPDLLAVLKLHYLRWVLFPIKGETYFWVGGLASPELHAIVILFARESAERARCVTDHEKLIAQCKGVEVLSTLDFYGRDTLRGPNGEVLATGQQAVLMDMNSFVWVSKKKIGILGKPKFSLSATLPIANNSLTSSVQGALSGGGGFADSYFQPFILGWQTKRADIRAVYGFLAPTGKFNAGANNNVGSGYWTNALSAGETFYLTENKKTALSAFEMYEFHTTQEGTNIHPGQTLSLDYSLTHAFPLREGLDLQLGIVGYEQFQTTDKTGPDITPAQSAAHYRVNALGFASNFILPARKVSVGFKYFREFSNSSTFQGYSAQITGAITF